MISNFINPFVYSHIISLLLYILSRGHLNSYLFYCFIFHLHFLFLFTECLYCPPLAAEDASGSEIPRRRRSCAPSPAARGPAPGPPAGPSASRDFRPSLSSKEEGQRPGSPRTEASPPVGMPIPEGGVAGGQESLKKEEALPGKSKS